MDRADFVRVPKEIKGVQGGSKTLLGHIQLIYGSVLYDVFSF